MEKYVKIVSTDEMFIGFKLTNILDIIGSAPDGRTFYVRYGEDRNIGFYKKFLKEENLLDYVESISVVAREECVVETYKTKPKEYWLDISYKHKDMKKIRELNKVLSELGFRDLGGSGSCIVDDNTTHWMFDENSPVKVVVREA